MPIYEYYCEECGQRYEQLILPGDTEPDVCVICCSGHLNRAISSCAFHLKGIGWAKDGYRNELTPFNNPANQGRPDKLAADLSDINEHRSRL